MEQIEPVYTCLAGVLFIIIGLYGILRKKITIMSKWGYRKQLTGTSALLCSTATMIFGFTLLVWSFSPEPESLLDIYVLKPFVLVSFGIMIIAYIGAWYAS